MIEIVAFDFNSELVIYRDGVEWAKLHYYYDDFEQKRVWMPFIPFLEVMFPGVEVFHLDYDVFYEEVMGTGKWDNMTVLTLARRLRYDSNES
jgi:hypothetical protein